MGFDSKDSTTLFAYLGKALFILADLLNTDPRFEHINIIFGMEKRTVIQVTAAPPLTSHTL